MSKDKVYRAGVIPFYEKNGEIKMLFQKPADKKHGGECFQLCKGKREKGESNKEAAYREGNEEIGLFSGNVINEHDLGNFLGRTRMYVVEIKDPDMFGDSDFEVQSTKWMTLDEFKKEGRSLHVPVVKAAHRCIMQDKKSDTNK